MNRQHKSTIKAVIRKNGKWSGFIAANLVNPSQITGPWCLGMKVTFKSLEELEETVSKFTLYNCNSELGRRVSFYETSGR